MNTTQASKSAPEYTEFHPRWYRPRVSTYWWLGRWYYLRFILRELSSIAVAYVVAMTLLQIYALKNPLTYARLQLWMHSPWAIAWHIIVFCFVLFHTVTWFNLAPTAMAVRIGGRRVPGYLISGPNYLAWLVVSLLVAWYIVRP